MMREMGELSEVPIEPKEQTALLDACVSQAGVIGGGVPGGEIRIVYCSPQV
jgi:phosphomevalonate kinase